MESRVPGLLANQRHLPKFHFRRRCARIFPTFSVLCTPFALVLISLLIGTSDCHTCGSNRIPYGIEVYRNGQPALLCSRPNCFDKTYADCDERALRSSCDSNTTWVGGFNKDLGNHQPLYVQCCEFEQLPLISEPLYSNVVIRPGEYFEGEEITDRKGEEVLAFDLITNLKRLPDEKNSTRPVYQIDVRRFYCSQMIRPKRYKPWHWP